MEEQGIYYFHQGTNYRSYELLGAHFNKDYTIFRVFAPNARIVSVVGEFNNWDTTSHVMEYMKLKYLMLPNMIVINMLF